MQLFKGVSRLSKIYSTEYDIPRPNKENLRGTSLKAQISDEDEKVQPVWDFTAEAWDRLGLSDEKTKEMYIKKPVELSIEVRTTKGQDNRTYSRTYISDVKIIEKK